MPSAIRSTARLHGDKYVINGQKTWSTRAVWADWCFGMFRTDPNSTRHHGLTFILVRSIGAAFVSRDVEAAAVQDFLVRRIA